MEGVYIGNLTYSWQNSNTCGTFLPNTTVQGTPQEGSALWEYGPGVGTPCSSLSGTITVTITHGGNSVTCTDPNGAAGADLNTAGPSGVTSCVPNPQPRSFGFTVNGFGAQVYQSQATSSSTSASSATSSPSATQKATASSTPATSVSPPWFEEVFSNPWVLFTFAGGIAVLLATMYYLFSGKKTPSEIEQENKENEEDERYLKAFEAISNAKLPSTKPVSYTTRPPEGYGNLDLAVKNMFYSLLTTETPPPPEPPTEAGVSDVVSVTGTDAADPSQADSAQVSQEGGQSTPPNPQGTGPSGVYQNVPDISFVEGEDFWIEGLKGWAGSLPAVSEGSFRPPEPIGGDTQVEPTPQVENAPTREVDPIIQQLAGEEVGIDVAILWLMGALPDQTQPDMGPPTNLDSPPNEPVGVSGTDKDTTDVL